MSVTVPFSLSRPVVPKSDRFGECRLWVDGGHSQVKFLARAAENQIRRGMTTGIFA